MSRAVFALIAVLSMLASVSRTQALVSYQHDILPIMKRSCQGCHNPKEPDAGFDVVSYEALLKGGKSGAAIVALAPDESLLVELISGEAPSMPKSGDPLSSEEVALIRRWIEEGATNDAAIPEGLTVELEPPVYTAPPVISALAYSPDGETLAVSGFREVLLHSTDGSELKARLVGESTRIESITYSEDGSVLCAVGGSPAQFGEAQLWDATTNRLIRAIRSTYDNIYGASLSPDGKIVAFGCGDNTARVVSTADGAELLKFENHGDWVFGTTFSRDGKGLVTAGRDGALKLVNVENGQFIDDINASNKGYGGVNAIARHPHADQVLSGGTDRIPRLYRIFRERTRDIGNTDFNLIRAIEPQSGSINAVAFSADGSQLAVGTVGGETRVYSVESGERVASMQGDDSAVFALAFHPDDEQLAVGGFDGQVRLFNPATGELIRAFNPVPMSESATN